jgi:hypothetical protein
MYFVVYSLSVFEPLWQYNSVLQATKKSPGHKPPQRWRRQHWIFSAQRQRSASSQILAYYNVSSTNQVHEECVWEGMISLRLNVLCSVFLSVLSLCGNTIRLYKPRRHQITKHHEDDVNSNWILSAQRQRSASSQILAHDNVGSTDQVHEECVWEEWYHCG